MSFSISVCGGSRLAPTASTWEPGRHDTEFGELGLETLIMPASWKPMFEADAGDNLSRTTPVLLVMARSICRMKAIFEEGPGLQ